MKAWCIKYPDGYLLSACSYQSEEGAWKCFLELIFTDLDWLDDFMTENVETVKQYYINKGYRAVQVEITEVAKD